LAVTPAFPESATRRCDKGERRFRHVGSKATAEIVFQDNNPKKAVGKCPNTINATKRQALLNAAIPVQNGDRRLGIVKRLYAVHQGVIYEAQTSDAGLSYHAYPYHGHLNARLVETLRRMAREDGFGELFEAWVSADIETRGRGR